MELHADFRQRVVLHAPELPWQPSPMKGVHRRMLDRIGDEVARATTIVRYAPESSFSAHVHGGGEEFIVLEGTFEDEHGVYPAGSYVRNPPTSRHTPGSKAGCVILVKLWQFDPDDRHQMSVMMQQVPRHPHGSIAGVSVGLLFEDKRETVTYEHWSANATGQQTFAEGAELFVLEGSLRTESEELRTGSWLRIPKRGHLSADAGPTGARIWMKTGHLSDVSAPAAKG